MIPRDFEKGKKIFQTKNYKAAYKYFLEIHEMDPGNEQNNEWLRNTKIKK